MGICSSKPAKPNRPPNAKGKIQIHCPICEQTYDTDDYKPYIVCSNKHKLCFRCLSSMRNHARLKKQEKLLCPFCKAAIVEDLVSTDSQIYNFLEDELDVIKKLPSNRQKLFAFSSIYLPHLHKFIKDEATGKKRQGNVESIEALKIKGKMLEEYETFEMDMLECMKGLRRIYLNNNQIKAIDISAYSHDKIQLIDLSSNLITCVKNFIGEANGIFTYLKVLNIKDNKIEEAVGINKLKYIQVVNFSHNLLKSLRFFEGCEQLRHLNVQFNMLDKNIEFYPSFEKLESLQLFGNHLPAFVWERYIRSDWKQLRLITAAVKSYNLSEKHSIHKRIVTIPHSPFLKLAIFQVVDDQPQNTDDIVENGQSLKKDNDLLQKARSVELSAESYSVYMQNQSFLKDIFAKAIRYHPFGINFNFKPYQYSKTTYEEDDRINEFKKLDDNTQPILYLQSTQILNTIKGKFFISFMTKMSNISIGIHQLPTSNRRVVLDFDKQTTWINSEEVPCKSLQRMKKASGERNIIMSLNVEQNSLEFVIDEVSLQKYSLVQKWEEYHFFVNLKTKGQSLKIIRNEIDLI